MDADQSATLQMLIAAIRKRWGNSAARLGTERADLPVIPTGFSQLDDVLKIGGIPRGRLTELLGSPTSGATTIALTLIASAQARGDVAGYIDLSRTFDAEYAAIIGVDLPSLLVARPPNAADALELIHALIASHGVGVLVIDSLALFQMQQRDSSLLAQALRVLPGPLAASPCALVALTPLPYKADMLRALAFGGSILAHAAAIRLHVARESWRYVDQAGVGYTARVTILKHRLAPPDGEAQVLISFDDRKNQ
jgi:recombination protein RecA